MNDKDYIEYLENKVIELEDEVEKLLDEVGCLMEY